MKNRVLRFDISRFDKIETMPQGYLRAPANATRVGIFVYKNADGSTRRELRLPEEVFQKDSLQSLAGVPLTNDHPAEQLLNTKNTRRYMVGYTASDVEHDDTYLKTLVTITDADTIDAVNNGKQELSCGYECDLEEKPGKWQGQPYDVIQRKIRYNHLALVNKGRAGDEVRLRTDSSDAVMVDTDITKPKGDKMGMPMKKLQIAGKEHDVPEEVANAHSALMAEHQKLKDSFDLMKKGQGGLANPAGQEESSEESGEKDDESEYDAKSDPMVEGAEVALKDSKDMRPAAGSTGAASKAAESMKSAGAQFKKPEGEESGMPSTLEEKAAKVDALLDENKKLKAMIKKDSIDPKAIRAAVKSRLRMEKVAHVVLKKDDLVKLDAMSDSELKKAIIVAEFPHVHLDGKSEVYVDVRFDTIAESIEGKAKELENAGAVMGSLRGSSGQASREDSGAEEGSAEKARAAATLKEKDLWKTPTGTTRKAK